jgi:hypothetical protein
MIADEPVAVWWNGGIPDRLVWQGQRWRVSDEPTPLTTSPDFLPSAMTHAPERTVGWRFQATDDAGDAVVLDIVRSEDQWAVVRCWT